MRSAQVNPVLKLSRKQIIDRIERGAQRRLGMSAKEFIRACEEGRIKDPGAVADLIALTHLLPEKDPLFEAA